MLQYRHILNRIMIVKFLNKYLIFGLFLLAVLRNIFIPM